MTADEGRGYVDALSLTDAETTVFETAANLEYSGQPLTRDQIVAATRLDGAEVDAALDSLVRRGLLRHTVADGMRVYIPGNRGWSLTPDQGHGLHGL